MNRRLLLASHHVEGSPVIPGATLFSTRRVHKQQFLLRPSSRVNQVILYIVAVLAQRYSNHGHDVETDPEGRIVEFQRDCHALITPGTPSRRGWPSET